MSLACFLHMLFVLGYLILWWSNNGTNSWYPLVLFRSEYFTLPVQAVRCKLAGIKPKGNLTPTGVITSKNSLFPD